MGVGNCTNEPVDYDVDNPGGAPQAIARSVLFSALSAGTAGLGIGALGCGVVHAEPLLASIGGALFLLGAAGQIGTWQRLRSRFTMPLFSLTTGRKNLNAGQSHTDPTPFSTPNGVRFYETQNGSAMIAEVGIYAGYYKVDIPSQPPAKTFPNTDPVADVNLDKDGSGYYEVHVLTQ